MRGQSGFSAPIQDGSACVPGVLPVKAVRLGFADRDVGDDETATAVRARFQALDLVGIELAQEADAVGKTVIDDDHVGRRGREFGEVEQAQLHAPDLDVGECLAARLTGDIGGRRSRSAVLLCAKAGATAEPRNGRDTRTSLLAAST